MRTKVAEEAFWQLVCTSWPPSSPHRGLRLWRRKRGALGESWPGREKEGEKEANLKVERRCIIPPSSKKKKKKKLFEFVFTFLGLITPPLPCVKGLKDLVGTRYPFLLPLRRGPPSSPHLLPFHIVCIMSLKRMMVGGEENPPPNRSGGPDSTFTVLLQEREIFRCTGFVYFTANFVHKFIIIFINKY